METKFCLEIQKGRDHLGDPGVVAKGNIKMGVDWI
jgi:hypothetical protein